MKTVLVVSANRDFVGKVKWAMVAGELLGLMIKE